MHGSTLFGVLHQPISQRIGQIREGIPAEEVDAIVEAIGVSKPSLLSVLGTPQSTVNRLIRQHRRLDPGASERLLRIAELQQRATEVFGDDILAKEWLTSANAALSCLPLELLDTEIGANQVRRVLLSIEYGLPV